MIRFAFFLANVLASTMTASPVVGTWEGKTNELPSVELTLREEGGHLAGTIAFYFQTRGDDGSWRLGPKTEVPLLSPKLEVNVLTFETTHHKKHGSQKLGPNNKYRVEFDSANEARLHMYKGGEPATDQGGPGLKLTRRQ
jgi:hypothetical protein